MGCSSSSTSVSRSSSFVLSSADSFNVEPDTEIDIHRKRHITINKFNRNIFNINDISIYIKPLKQLGDSLSKEAGLNHPLIILYCAADLYILEKFVEGIKFERISEKTFEYINSHYKLYIKYSSTKEPIGSNLVAKFVSDNENFPYNAIKNNCIDFVRKFGIEILKQQLFQDFNWNTIKQDIEFNKNNCNNNSALHEINDILYTSLNSSIFNISDNTISISNNKNTISDVHIFANWNKKLLLN